MRLRSLSVKARTQSITETLARPRRSYNRLGGTVGSRLVVLSGFRCFRLHSGGYCSRRLSSYKRNTWQAQPNSGYRTGSAVVSKGISERRLYRPLGTIPPSSSFTLVSPPRLKQQSPPLYNSLGHSISLGLPVCLGVVTVLQSWCGKHGSRIFFLTPHLSLHVVLPCSRPLCIVILCLPPPFPG